MQSTSAPTATQMRILEELERALRRLVDDVNAAEQTTAAELQRLLGRPSESLKASPLQMPVRLRPTTSAP